MKYVAAVADPSADPVDVSTADESTRRRVFGAVMAQGSLTAVQLSELLGITPTAVRRHLEALRAEGLIVARPLRRTTTPARGRPAKAYQITDAGRDRFYQAYGELAVQAIDQLLATAGPDGLSRLASAHFSPLRQTFDTLRVQHPGVPLADVLAQALQTSGYAAELTHLAGGEQLCQHHCPVADVAREFPQLCEAETKLIASLLDSHVQRLATIAHGDGVCTTNIPKALTLEAPHERT